HVAGSHWPQGQKHGTGPGLRNTEHDVTYNEGKHGADVVPTRLGSAKDPQNRGCLSQNGAEALGSAWGYTFGDILRFFYGEDIDLTIAEYHVTPPPAPAPRAPRAPEAPRPSSGDGGLLAGGLVALR